MNRDLSIYVHTPFCERKCNYCDFLSFNAGKELMDAYYAALEKELIACSLQYSDRKVRTIFFGGGTPSFPDAKTICNLLKSLRDHYLVADDAEISMECNPASAIQEKLFSYRDAGFNRLSIGCQSLDDNELKVLGRLHNSDMFYRTYESARAAGFDNINIDIMSALPNQSLESYLRTLDKITVLKPEHISAYSLILEEGTPFYDMDLNLPDEETDREMYHKTMSVLSDSGYHRYEISNYALGSDDRFECRHNKVYWQRCNYLGLGLGSASMIDNVRFSNTRDIDTYIKELSSVEISFDKIRENVEELSLTSQMEEFMFLGLRLVKGVSVSEFKSLFEKDILEVYGDVIDKYVNLGLLEHTDHVKLTEKGMDVANTVMADFLL